MVIFPVYVRDDAKCVMSFSSIKTMQAYLELVDIENHEYEAWDAQGRILELAVGKPRSEWLKIVPSDRSLPEREFAEIKAVAQPYVEPSSKGLLSKLGFFRADD